MATVFVGVPTLNRPHLVADTIASLHRQTFGDYRVVVSDNRSDGDAADRVAGHIERLADVRFSFYRQPENGGEYGQGRFFFGVSDGHEFFMILHDDDMLDPEYLEIGVRTLRRHPDCALFAANPHAIDGAGLRWPTRSAAYRKRHGREGMSEGPFDILSTHVMHGLTPISGTLFRRSDLERSGFADPDGRGNYPFECDVFLRLGDLRARGWFTPRELVSLRFHDHSMRNYLRLVDNPPVVHAMLGLFDRRRFAGPLERRRKVLISRLHRAEALIKLRQGDVAGCRTSLRLALRENRRPHRGWALAPLAWLCPGLLRAMAPPLPPTREGPAVALTQGRSDALEVWF
jgi:glycosyltransferase involved in cell wall biosynthesis